MVSPLANSVHHHHHSVRDFLLFLNRILIIDFRHLVTPISMEMNPIETIL